MKDTSQSKRDRRKFPRRFVEIPITLTLEDGKTQQLVLKDISVTGSRIYSSKNMTDSKALVHSKAKVQLSLPQNSADSMLSGQIAWLEGNHIGLLFEGSERPDPQMVKFILEKANDIEAFTFEVTVFLKDTNAFGNTYFARYFEWQGMAREAFLQVIVSDPSALMRAGIKFITVNAFTEYYHETVLYDTVLLKTHAENIKNTSFELIFDYYDKRTTRLVAKGKQKIAFADHKGRIIQVPDQIAKPLSRYSNHAV